MADNLGLSNEQYYLGLGTSLYYLGLSTDYIYIQLLVVVMVLMEGI